MVAITKIVVLAATASAAILPRTVQQIQADLATINNDTITLTNDVNAYQGGVQAALPVANDEDQLDSDIQAATTDANNTPPVTSAQATTIINYITGTLTPNIKKALDALVGKKSQFTAAGLKGTVLGDLQSLKSDTDALATALIKKSPPQQTASASAAQSTIDTLFASAINAYSS